MKCLTKVLSKASVSFAMILIAAGLLLGAGVKPSEANAQGRDYKLVKKTYDYVIIECVRGVRRQFKIVHDDKTDLWVYRRHKKKNYMRIGKLLCS